MSLLIICVVLVGLSALSHGLVPRRLIANLLPACLVCSGLVGYEVLILRPEHSALGGLVLPFIFMTVLIVSLFVGMVMNLLRWSAFARLG